MLDLGNAWSIEGNGIKRKVIEYRRKDFYGPFLKLNLRQFENESIEISPWRVVIESAEVSETHFSLLVTATKEIFKEFGPFTLHLTRFDVLFDSEDTERLILDELKKIKLF